MNKEHPNKYQELFNFMKQLNEIKRVKREITNPDGTKEDDAQHMYMMCLLMVAAEDLIPVNVNKLHTIKIMLVHDLVEIIADDTWYLDPDKVNKKQREAKAAEILFVNRPEFFSLWTEYELRETEEAKLAKELDVVQAVLSLVFNSGQDWKRNRITREREMAFSAFIHQSNTPIGNFLKYVFELATSQCLFYEEEVQ